MAVPAALVCLDRLTISAALLSALYESVRYCCSPLRQSFRVVNHSTSLVTRSAWEGTHVLKNGCRVEALQLSTVERLERG